MIFNVDAEWRYAAVDRWTEGAASVVLLTFDVDGETALLGDDPRFATMPGSLSQLSYGPTVGVPHILAMLERQGKPATFFVPGWTADHHPHCVERILEAGHEIGHHGYLHLMPTALDAGAQREELERGLEALARHGVTPVGYRAPSWELSRETIAMLPEYGLTYDSSLMDDDRPYLLDTAGGHLAELPSGHHFDDWVQYGFFWEPDMGRSCRRPGAVAAMWREEIDAARQERSLVTLVNHPLLSGRPARVRALETVIEYADSLSDVTFARCGDVARRLLEAPNDELTAERPD